MKYISLRHHNIFLFNMLLFSACLAFSYHNYNGRIIGYGDSFVFLNPNRNSSFIEFIEHWYMNFGGRLNRIIIWAGLQRLSDWFNITNPLEYPWFITVAIKQFCLLAIPMNASIFFKRTLNLRLSTSIIIYIAFLGTYSLNIYFVGYSFNTGVGFYTFKIYLITLLMLSLLNFNKNINIGTYVIYFILMFDDMTPVFAYIFVNAYLIGYYYEGKLNYVKLKHNAILLTIIFTICPIVIFTAPGNIARFGYQTYFLTDIFERLILLCHRVIYSTYNNFDIFNNNTHFIHYLLFSFIFIIIFKSLYTFARSRDKINLYRINTSQYRLIILLLVSVVGLYASQLRVFASGYHADYSDSNPSYFLIIIYLLLFIYIYNIFNNKFKLYINLYTIILLLYFLIYPQYNKIKYVYQQSLSVSSYLINTYNMILNDHINITDEIIINGHIAGIKYLHKNDIVHMFNWGKYIPKVYIAGYDKLPDIKSTIEVDYENVNLDKLNYDINKPLYLGSRIYFDHKAYDYYVPDSICNIFIKHHPNIAGSSQYVNKYLYKFTYSNGSGSGPSVNPNITLLHKSESPLDHNYKLKIYRPSSSPYIVRFDIYGGGKLYMNFSSAIKISCV